MAQKYEIYHETGWDESTNTPTYKRLTVLKSEQAAIEFISDIENIGKYGNLRLCSKVNGKMLTFDEKLEKWV